MTIDNSLAPANGGGGSGQFANNWPLDRLVRKEVALGSIREKQPPSDHIGLSIVPFLDVATDDVIFDYIKGGLQEGLAPARAEDAEAELSQKDDLAYGQGRASVIDWSLKDKYTASDVSRYRDALLIAQKMEGVTSDLNQNFVGRTVDDFQKRMARDDVRRRRYLDNRIEWLIWQALGTNQISYNDGKIKFTVTYGRPANQERQAPLNGPWDVGTNSDFDPIGDILDLNEKHYDKYGVYLKTAYTSKKILNGMYKSSKFREAMLFASGANSTASSGFDPNYIGTGLGVDFAVNLVERQTGITFKAYDTVYRTRPIGSSTFTNVRYHADDQILFLPDEADLGEIDDTELGFGKVLTSPHPEGNWSSGYYEWETESKDPWLHTRGTGIKAFPVLPYMQYTYTMKVTV
jgi:hypothetical protein